MRNIEIRSNRILALRLAEDFFAGTMIVVSLSWASAFAQQAAPTTILNYPDTMISGAVSAEMPIPADKCQKVCTERHGCVGFDYSQAGGTCRIFAAVASAQHLTGWTAGTRSLIPGYPMPTNPPSPTVTPEVVPSVAPPPASFARFTHYDITGYDLGDATSNSVDNCESQCRASQQCQAYTFNAWNRRCFLKRGGANLRLEPRGTSGMISTLQHPEYLNKQTVMEYYNKAELSGTVLDRLGANSRDECEQSCWGSNQCSAFSFNARRRSCTLLSDAQDREPQSGTQSGAKIQPKN